MMTMEIARPSSPATSFPPKGEICFEVAGQRVCFPIGSTGPTIPINPLSAGPLHGSFLRQAMRRFRAAKSDRRQFYRNEIDGLRADGLISEAEVRSLHDVLEETMKADKGDQDARTRLRAIAERLIDDRASPVAIVIAGIAVDSTGNPTAAAGTATGDVAGAIGGAGVGAAVGSGAAGVGAVPGAVLGGLIGGLATSLAIEIDNN